MLERLPHAQGADTDRPGALMATGRAMLRLEGSLQRMKGGNFFKEAVPKGAKRARRLAVSVFSIRSVRLYAMSFDHNSSTLRVGRCAVAEIERACCRSTCVIDRMRSADGVNTSVWSCTVSLCAHW